MGIKFIIFRIPGSENLAGAFQNSVYHRTQEQSGRDIEMGMHF